MGARDDEILVGSVLERHGKSLSVSRSSCIPGM